MVDIFTTPQEMALHIAGMVQAQRLLLNLSQKSLSERSGVSFGVIKKFERTGKISLESLLKLALALDCIGAFSQLFTHTTQKTFSTLDDLLSDKKRKRGRI
jgi:transcriptional regulator with XRE-family HTH domain